MGTFLRNTISKFYNTVSAPVTAMRDALAGRLESIRETASLLYNRMMENMEYGRQRLKVFVEKEAEEEAKEQQQEEAAKEQQQYDNEQYDMAAQIRLVYEVRHVKEFRVDWKFKQIQHRDDHGQHHNTH